MPYTIKPYILKIRDLPQGDKPREKLLHIGARSLTTAELLAIIFGTGTQKEDVLTMASRVLKDYGERALTASVSPLQLSTDLAIPLGKATQMAACAELGRRFFAKSEAGAAVLRTADDVYAYVRDMHRLPKEHLRGLYLNTHYTVIYDEIISIGTIDANLVHPREIFKPAIAYGAAAIILAHNHPSGVLEPSQADEEITEQLSMVGKIIGIEIIDHLIIGEQTFVSLYS